MKPREITEGDASALHFDDVELTFQRINDNALTVLKGLNLEIRPGSFVSIVGPSGCGKTTILNLAAGLLRPSSGSVESFGHTLNGVNPRASYVSQADALLPWKTVAANIALGLQLRGLPTDECSERLIAWLSRMGLQGFAHSYPGELSGGMRKRVSLAQAWIVEPDLVLMDEPFSMLDVFTRQHVEEEILSLWSAQRDQTVVFVTHDLEEAILLSDEVIVVGSAPITNVLGRFSVDLPRPRALAEMKADSSFVETYRKIWANIREEMKKSYEANAWA